MTSRVPTEETPFNLIFRIEVVIPVEIRILSARTENFDKQTNSQKLRTNLNLLKEVKKKAHIRMVAYQQKII